MKTMKSLILSIVLTAMCFVSFSQTEPDPIEIQFFYNGDAISEIVSIDYNDDAAVTENIEHFDTYNIKINDYYFDSISVMCGLESGSPTRLYYENDFGTYYEVYKYEYGEKIKYHKNKDSIRSLIDSTTTYIFFSRISDYYYSRIKLITPDIVYNITEVVVEVDSIGTIPGPIPNDTLDIVTDSVYTNLNPNHTITISINRKITKYRNTLSVNEEVLNVINTLVYPNPVVDNLNIVFESIDRDVEVGIYNMNGRLLFRDDETRSIGVNKITVDMSNYDNGIYLVRLGNVVKKIIK